EASPMPPAFSALDRGSEVTLGPMAPADAEEVASLFTGHRLSPEAAKRWAKRGGYRPLGIAEALAEGLATGDLSWLEDVAVPRRRVDGPRGEAEPMAWTKRRFALVPPAQRPVLFAAAIIGSEAKVDLLQAILERAAVP